MSEDILDPDLPIVDPHHHLWDFTPLLAADARDPRIRSARILAPVAALSVRRAARRLPRGGHNIVATVFLECGAFYRADGPPELKPVGEVEFVNGVAARRRAASTARSAPAPGSSATPI